MRLEVDRGETASVRPLNNELLEVEFEGREISKKELFAFDNLDMKKDKLTLKQGQYVMERRLEELQFVVSPSQKSTPRDGNCLPESLFDQAQYVPELAGVVVDAYELRVQVVLSLENSVKQGLLEWPGGDETLDVENEIGTQRQWKQKMLLPGAWGDAVFLRLASLYLETDIILIPAFRESGENTTLGYTVIRAEKRTSSEPLYLFYFSDTEFKNPHYQSVRPATEYNILRSIRSQDGTLLETKPEPIMQSTAVSFQIQEPSLQLPDGSSVSSRDVNFVFDRYFLMINLKITDFQWFSVLIILPRLCLLSSPAISSESLLQVQG